MSVVLLAQSPAGLAIACDSASFLGDWQIPGGLPKVWPICQGEVMVGMCGNKRWRQLFPFAMLESLTVGSGDFDAAGTIKAADAVVDDALRCFARDAANHTDKRGEDGMLTTDLEMVIVVPKVNRVYYIAGLTLTVIDLSAHPHFVIGLGAGGVAAQAAASAFGFVNRRLPNTVPISGVVLHSVEIACGMLASCMLPALAWTYDMENFKWC